MKWISKIVGSITLTNAVALALCSGTTSLAATSNQSSNFAQIVLGFPAEKKFSYEWSKKDNSLHMSFPGTSAEELDALNNYDETLIRRILLKDLGNRGTEVRIVFRDSNVEGLVSTFTEPYRIVVDLFDKNYREPKDPVTGLPLNVADSYSGSEDEQTGGVTSSPNHSKISDNRPPLKKQLIQPMAPVASSPNELQSIISKIDGGMGKAWASFPPYIYRMQLAPAENKNSKSDELKHLQTSALTTSEAMADYASKLFDLGHEGRALAAYQQVLQREPEIFENNVMHLWKLAEAHLGMGNLTLAQGYYQTLIDRNPEHLMAQFAKLRKIDVQAVRAIDGGDNTKLAKLADQTNALATRDNAELQAMIALRSSWWSDSSIDQKSRSAVASCTEDTELKLTKLMPKIENPKTAYLSSAIIAKRLTNSQTNWQNQYAAWLGNFFNRYRGAQNPITTELSEATRKRITDQFKNLFEANKSTEVVALFEQLPKEMKSISKDPQVSWQIAESYRSLGQSQESLPFYEKAAQSELATDKFRSQFWIAALSAKHAVDVKAKHGNQKSARVSLAAATRSDREMGKIWEKLTSDEKSKLLTALGSEFKNITASDASLRTPAKIVLEQYKSALTVNPPKLDATPTTGNPEWLGNFSPSAATVKLLDDLGRKFADLGMTNERREALQLMRFIKPTQLEEDKAAAKLWAAEMTKLAEEHRKADEFLEAGEIYTQMGEVSALGDSKAESLYKGGLLLFRAGKKEDAIKALEKAKGDPNNLFYSKLATERLNQIGH